jgi:peptide/nickel transport system substrate-binding protein
MNRVNIIKFRLYSTEMLSRKIKTIVSACAGIQTFSTLQRIPGIVLSMLGFSRSRRWFRKFIGLFAIACFLVVSCGQPQTPTVTTDPDRVIIGTTEKIRTLDPADAYEVASGTFLYNMGDRLYTYKLGTTEIIPQLATELPNISEDGKTYTIPIREGVTFHDGTPFNAEAMTFSLRRFAENGGSPSSLLSGVVESIQATGENELTITLKKPFAAFTALLTFPGLCAVSPQAYEIGANKFKSDSFIGTGPYKLASYGTDSIKLDANPDYWGEPPLNKGIDIQRFSSPANVYNAFITGAVDISYGTLDLDQVADLESQASSKGWQVISERSNGIYVLTMNLKDKELSQLKVREAIASLINRDLIKNRVFRGQIEPLYSLIPATLPEFYQPVFQEKYGDGDITKVKAALTEAGYSEQNPLKLEIWYRSNLKSNADAATTIKAFAAQEVPGLVEIELKSVESATAYDNLDKGVYPMFIMDWVPDFLDPDNYIQPFLSCSEGSAETGCESGKVNFGVHFITAIGLMN